MHPEANNLACFDNVSPWFFVGMSILLAGYLAYMEYKHTVQYELTMKEVEKMQKQLQELRNISMECDMRGDGK